MDFDLTTLFDPATLKGLVALASVHLHLRSNAKSTKALEARVKVLEEGHAGDVTAHRELGATIAAAEARR